MKWILANDLDRWADTQIGRAEIAGLVGQLICATVQSLHSFRFPSGDAGQIPGFDGHLIAEAGGVPPFVPGGESVWEFGTAGDYLRKANDDYRSRTENPGSIDPSTCAFVFVTPRKWDRATPTLVDWVKERNREGKWKSVVAIDAIQLEDWLGNCEAVAKNFAREVRGFPPVDGARSVREFWEEYSERFRPRLVEAVVLCERQGQADELIQQLVSGVPQSIRLQADSRDEVIAFAAAAIRTAEKGVKDYLEARTLVLDTRQAAEERRDRKGLIFLPRDAAVDLAGGLLYRAPTVIPLARDDRSAKALARPSSYGLAQALKLMGFDDERAERLARECGRSVTILARRIWSVQPPSPPWEASQHLVASLLAGAWDDSSEGDKHALATLANCGYEDFERSMRPLLLHPEPLEREGSVWKIRAPVDTFVRLGPSITGSDLARLRAVATMVFEELDPALDLPLAERRYAALQGNKMRYSEWLRDGLATTLLQLAVLHEEARVQVTGFDPQGFVNELVEHLVGLRTDARLLISLGRQLTWLMEAAPHPLLAALECLLEGDGGRILPVFDEDDSMFSSASHTDLLWSLEMLAWDAQELPRVALDLARLARLDPGGRLANRPIRSLVGIFKAWMPQTKASLSQRLAVIDQVTANEPDIGWQLVLGLLPIRQDFGQPHPRPRLREPRILDYEPLTDESRQRAFREVVSRAIRLARGVPDRLLVLIKTMDRFSLDEMGRICDELENAIPVECDRRTELWNDLRNVVSMHRAYKETNWALPPSIVDRLRSLKDRLEPADPIIKIKWLFEQHYPDLDHATGAQKVAAVEEARSTAIRQLHADEGDRGVCELARQSKFPGLVGVYAAGLFTDVVGFDQMIRAAGSLPDIPDLFLIALSGFAYKKLGARWSLMIGVYAKEGRSPAQIATLILGWDDERAAWDLAEALGPEVVRSFWSRRMSMPVRGGTAEQERAAREYLRAGRYLAALDVFYEASKQLPPELVFQILDGAMVELAGASLGGNLVYEIGEFFDNLAARQDIDQSELARREYAYLPLLKHRSSTLALHRLMVNDPSFFVSVLCDVFKPASGDEREPTDEAKGRARQGYELLSGMTDVPGFGQAADSAELERWVVDVRRIAADCDRAKIADQYIGQLLARCPGDPDDHGWPHRFVRDLIEELKSDEVERGIEMGRTNMQGAHFIDPKYPAAAEHHLAGDARKWAGIAMRWRRTSAMLTSMAEHWEWYAKALEQRSRQEAMRD